MSRAAGKDQAKPVPAKKMPAAKAMSAATAKSGAAKATADTRRNYPVYNWRFYFLGGVLVLGFVGLGVRAGYLQLVENSFLQKESAVRALRDAPIASYRGSILDRNGQQLAVSIEVASLYIDPREIKEKHDAEGLRQGTAWHQLAALLGLKTSALNKLVENNAKKHFVWVKRQLEPTVAKLVRQLDLPGVHLTREYRRSYPAGEVAAHVVGFTNIDEKGIEGIERAFDEQLTGTPGSERQLLDRKRRVVESQGVLQEAEPGQDIELALDGRLQNLTFRELRATVNEQHARAGSAVILDVNTGEVLAMANLPSYNPNKRNDRPKGATRNRAITDMFEPGSTVKPLVVVGALESGKYTPHTVIDTRPGYLRVGGSWVRDTSNHGVLDVTGVIKKSSNIGVTQMALSLSKEQFLGTYERFGLGQPLNTGFPGETAGRLNLDKRWSKFELATASYGYGLTASPLQIASAYATLASGGIKRPVSMLKVKGGVIGERVADEHVTQEVLAMMREVITDGGTGKRAKVGGYCVSGKTGTVHKAVAGGYSDDYFSVFAGIAPCENPRLVMVVVVDEPSGDKYYGGDIAAPVFSAVMDQALRLINVAPDDKSAVRVGQQQARASQPNVVSSAPAPVRAPAQTSAKISAQISTPAGGHDV
ncbi:peptidoglycan glycosyltransferase FtsI [Permianibacter sp. IMCC34836]|uniref:peptidoglycan D,D-transpeptidase FtsI family protein n=1 Tax=Permianibacter fluminis TaxID=2738515 RepID=UPI0015537AFA|nr:penicillin-binding transpeptidase domain-containing protein [Permianibacter fluminis]NQD37008.1 peptidoglycan glycosyltransferase FtsI [Permianibacter fluminis]